MVRKYFFLFLYRLIFRHLPKSTFPILGPIGKQLRYFSCRNIFEYCGKNVNIEKGASFGYGFQIEIGDNSGIGLNSSVPGNIKIGSNVMMGPNVVIHVANHKFDRIDIPICQQGSEISENTIIEDDVWIGSNVILTPGRRIAKGSIVGTGSVVTKNFPNYSIIGGNPAKLIRSRL